MYKVSTLTKKVKAKIKTLPSALCQHYNFFADTNVSQNCLYATFFILILAL